MESKTQAGQIVLEALYLDDSGHYSAAYMKYLEGVQALSGYLLEQVKDDGMLDTAEVQINARKALVLVRQCIDRLDILLTHKNEASPADKKDEIDSLENCPLSEKSWASLNSMPCHNNQELPLSNVTFETVPFVQKPATSLRLTPMEKTQYENARLLRLFHARISRTTDPTVKANLNLELQRRLNENFAVTKVKQREYVKQEQKKMQKALEQASRKLSALCKISTPQMKEKQYLYAKILHFETKKEWPFDLRKKLNNASYEVVTQVVHTVLRSSEHPLAKWLSDKQEELQSAMKRLLNDHQHLIVHLPEIPYSTHRKCKDKSGGESAKQETGAFAFNSVRDEFEELLGISLSTCEISWSDVADTTVKEIVTLHQEVDSIVENVCSTLQTVLQMLYLSYETLQKEGTDYFCYEAVEHYLNEPLWEHLLILFRLSNIRSEQLVAQAMMEVHENGLHEFGIPEALFNSQSELYSEVVLSVEKIPLMQSLLQKVQIMVQVCQKICDIQHQNDQILSKYIGADDLIPILCYILVQTRLPQLVSECQAVAVLLDQRYMLGEEGYCLTSFQTALKYLEIKRVEKRCSRSLSCDAPIKVASCDADVFT